MYATDPPGDKNADARHICDAHGSSHGGGSDQFFAEYIGHIPEADLPCIGGLTEAFYLSGGQSHAAFPVQDGNGGGYGALVAYFLFNLQGRFHVLRPGHAVGDDGGFERHYGFSFGKGRFNLGMYVQPMVHGSG